MWKDNAVFNYMIPSISDINPFVMNKGRLVIFSEFEIEIAIDAFFLRFTTALDDFYFFWRNGVGKVYAVDTKRSKKLNIRRF